MAFALLSFDVGSFRRDAAVVVPSMPGALLGRPQHMLRVCALLDLFDERTAGLGDRITPLAIGGQGIVDLDPTTQRQPMDCVANPKLPGFVDC